MAAGASHRGPPGDEEGTMHRTIPPIGRRLFQLLLLLAVAAASAAGCGRPAPGRPPGIQFPELTGVVATRHYTGEMTFSPDGKTLGLPIYASPIELWSLETGKAQYLVSPFGKGSDGGSAAAHLIVFSSDGRTLAAAYPGRSIVLWDIPAGEERSRIPIAREIWVADLAFADGGRSLVAVTVRAPDDDPAPARFIYSVARWDILSGERRGDVDLGPRTPLVAFSPDGRHAVFRDSDKDRYAVYDLATGAEVLGLDNPGSLYGYGSYAFSADGATLVCYNRSRLSLLEVPSGKERKRLPFIPPTGGDTNSLSLSADSRLLAVAGLRGRRTVGLVSLESGRVLGAVEYGPPGMLCRTICLSPDGHTLATNTWAINDKDQSVDPLLKLWSIALPK